MVKYQESTHQDQYEQKYQDLWLNNTYFINHLFIKFEFNIYLYYIMLSDKI